MPNVRSIIANSRSRSAGPIIYPRNIAKYGMLFMFSKYDYNATRSVVGYSSDSLTGESVVLPLPTGGLAENTSISLSESDLTAFGELFAQGANAAFNGGGMDQFIGSFSSSDMEAPAASRIAAIAGIAAMAKGGGPLAAVAGGGAIQPALSVGTGTAFNKFTALSFNAVDLRTHTFNWKFFPESRADSETIATIRNMFQKAAHPSYANLGTGTGQDILGRVVLNYPLLVRPYILIDQSEQYYYQFKPCLISSVQFAYRAESGMSFVENGKPAQVEMSLTMKEASIWTADDYGGGSNELSPFASVGVNYPTGTQI